VNSSSGRKSAWFGAGAMLVLWAGFAAPSAFAADPVLADAAVPANQMAYGGTATATGQDGKLPSKDALEEVTILAQRTTAEIARAAQLQAPNLINLTTATEMARLPDVNTGEAVRRIPGISLETDTGEGRYINIRGLDADLNSTTFGGLRLPPTNNSSPSGAARAVAFDSIPIGFVGAITVTKSNLPEQDAEALGGTIDITPKTAPSDGRPFVDTKLGTGYEVERKTWITDVAASAGTRFGGSAGGYQPFSVLVVGSLYTDRRGIDDAEAGFIDNQSGGVPDKAFAGFEQRYYQYHRERHGYGIDFGFAPDENNKYFARYYDAGYSETVQRNRLSWNYSGAPTVDPANPNGFLDTATFSKTLRDEKEYLDSKVFAVGGRNLFSGNTLDYHVGYTKGSYDKPYDYNASFNNPALANVSYDNTTQPNWPVVKVLPGTAANGTVTVNPAAPAGYVLTGMRNQVQHSDDHEWGIGANLTIPTHFTDRVNEQIKIGLNARIRDKTGDQTSYSLANVPTVPLGSVVYGGNILYYQDHYYNGPNIDANALRAIYAANGGAVTGGTPDPLSLVHDKEDIYAGYGQYQFGFGALGVVAGARVEATKATYAGYKDDASSGTDVISPVSTDRSYANFFPTAQARYEFTPHLIGRLAISSTIARPGFQQVTATTTVDNSGNIVTGNPDLKPTTATGFDVAIEHYLPHAGIASLGLFEKELSNYIVNNVQQVAGGQQKSGGNLGIIDIVSYANAPTAHLLGVEVNYVNHFQDALPGAWGGLGLSANWTWVQSKYKIRPGEDSLLPSTSRNTGNIEALYDLDGVHLSLGAYYTSRNIFGVGGSAALDIWTQERLSMDFGSQWQINEPCGVYLNVKNLTNTPLKFTEGPSENRVIQREFYSTTIQAGVTYKFL